MSSVLSMARISVACLILLMAGCSDGGPARQEDTAQVAGYTDALADVHDGKAMYELYCIACHGQGPGHPGTMRLQERVGEEQAALLDRDNLPPDLVGRGPRSSRAHSEFARLSRIAGRTRAVHHLAGRGHA